MSKKIKIILIIACLALLVYPCVIQPFIEYGSLSIRQMALPAAFMTFVILAKENE